MPSDSLGEENFSQMQIRTIPSDAGEEIVRSSPGPRIPMQLAVVQPSPFCNIDCTYCYLPERSDTRRMTEDTVRHMARFFLAEPERLHKRFTILWHGGEPTAVPVSFYESAFRILHEMNPARLPVQNRFSTNGTLLTHEWCSLIRRWNVTMRVSIDGPHWLHDIKRVDRAGRGTFDRVMTGVELLRSSGIPFDVICTLTDRSLDSAEEMWRFYRQIGAGALHFCVEEVLGVHRMNSLQTAACYSRLQSFFRTLLELRNREAPGFYIRELDELIDGIPVWKKAVVRDENIPLMVVSIAWDGGISTFSPELLGARHPHFGDFIFGNVATHSPADIWRSAKMQQVYRDIRRGIRNCERSCEYYKICGGGCPAAKLFETGTFAATETLSCRLRIKAVSDVALEHLGLPSRAAGATTTKTATATGVPA